MHPTSLQPKPCPSVERWLADARCGSQEALGSLLETFRNYLLMVANRGLDPQLQAKGGGSDLVQETFLEAQRAFGQFHGGTEAELLHWLRTILHNNLANFRRRYWATEMRAVTREVALEDVGPLGDGDAPLTADLPTPSRAAMAKEEAQKLQRALERLPESHRRVVLLRNRDHRSFDEIGAALGRSAEATRKLWVRAIAQLQKELKAL